MPSGEKIGFPIPYKRTPDSKQVIALDGQTIDIASMEEELKQEAKRRQERYKKRSFTDFLRESDPENVFDHTSAGGNLLRAIEDKGTIVHPWGNEYPFFSQRTDEYKVAGNEDKLKEIVDFLKGHEKRTESRYKILLIIGRSGSGKSIVADALKMGFEEYTRTCEPPIYAISGCPIQENPLNIFTSLKNNDLQAKLPADAKLCPDCRDRLQKEFDNDPTRFSVEPLDISVGKGIIVLQADVTKGYPQDAIKSLIRSASRGILELVEYGEQSDDLRKNLSEIMSSKVIQIITYNPRTSEAKQQQYDTDYVVIATTTLEEWEILRAHLEKEFPGELRRIKEIYWPFVTALKDEISIYQKLIDLSDYQPHISPQALEVLAKTALRTRLKTVPYKKGDKTLQIGPEEKFLLYDGKNTSELSQDDRLEIQKISRERKEGESIESIEGMKGLPPTFMKDVVSLVIADHPECITPLDALIECEKYIKGNPGKLPPEYKNKKDEIIQHVLKAKSEYETWLQATVRKALRPNYDQDIQRLFLNYYDNLQLLKRPGKQDNQPQDIFDQNTKEKQPDLKLLQEIENAFNEKMTDKEREEFRENVINIGAATARPKKALPFELDSFPNLKKAIEAKLGSDDKTKFLNLFTTNAPSEDQLDERKEIRQRLIDQYGFCQHCVDNAIKLTERQLRQLPIAV